MLTAGKNTLMSILPLQDGGLLFASCDPALGQIDVKGRLLWSNLMPNLDFRKAYEYNNFQISERGNHTAFGFRVLDEQNQWRHHTIQLNLLQQRLALDNTAHNMTAQVQKALADLGHDPGPVDGQIGPKTRNAIRRFQQSIGFTVDGEISPALRRELGVLMLEPPRIKAAGLDITDWYNNDHPKLNGQPISLKNYERSRCIAISSDGKRFLLGTEWYLRCFNRAGTEIWKAPTPSAVRAVNISDDGTTAAVLYGDGTLRWHRMSDGRERLAFYMHRDLKRWVLWTPEGFFDFGEGGDSLIGYHLNQGADAAGEFVGVDQLRHLFYRPDLVAACLTPEGEKRIIAERERIGDVAKILKQGLPPEIRIVNAPTGPLASRDFMLELEVTNRGGGIGRAVYTVNGRTVENEGDARPVGPSVPGRSHRIRRPFTLPAGGTSVINATIYNDGDTVASAARQISLTVGTKAPKPPALHGLAVGISRYYTSDLNLKYADTDALDFAQALRDRAIGLFREVNIQPIVNEQATTAGIETAFKAMAERVAPEDVFILFLAGHGTAENGRYYFVPHEVKVSSMDALYENSLDEDDLRRLISGVNAQKSIVLLDTCHAAAMHMGIRGIEERAALDRLMNATGRNILAAASRQQFALEGYQNHGLFTYVLLDALKNGAADRHETYGNKDGYISIREVADYIGEAVPRLSLEKWQYRQVPMSKLEGLPFDIGTAQ